MHLEFRTRRDRRTYRAFRQCAWIEAETLESRQLLSTSAVNLSALTAVPAVASTTPSAIPGLTPSQIAKAYNFSSSDTGAGETIAIVDAYNDPNIAKDLATFSSQFGLPDAAGTLSVVNESGGASLPAASASWSEEIALDVESAHAAAPDAKILLVEASSANLGDLLTGVQYASSHANVVSMSWGGPEFFGESQYDSVFNVPGVTFVASAGDTPGTSWPAVSPNVVGVGGTTLTLSSTGGYGSESIWNSTGGGISSFESAPSYQAAYDGLLGVGARVSPDVGFNANPSSGVAVYDSYQNSYSTNGWFQVGGTSEGAPEWAGIFADADALRSSAAGSLSSTSALTALYSAARSSTTDFHSVTAGAPYFLNTSTGTTFSLGAGLGTPNAANIIAALANTTTTAATTGTTGSTGSGSTGSGSTGGGSTGGGSTGGGSTGGGFPGKGSGAGGGRHHGFFDPSTITQISLAPVATPTLAGSFGAVTTATSAAASAAASPAQAIAAPSGTSNLARPVQPVSTTFPRLISSSGNEQEQAEADAVLEGNAANAEAQQQPVAPPVVPAREAVPDNNAPKIDQDAAPKLKDNAPIQTPLLIESWDDVLAEFDGKATGFAPSPVEITAEQDGTEPISASQSALAAGAAVFLWGSWEVRSRLNSRRARRSFLERSRQ